MNNELEIHIGKAIEAKTGKKLPTLAVRLLERLIHEREINAFLCQYGDLDGISFSKQLLDELNVSVEWKYEERLPLDGRAMFVSNHPLGAMDGISLSYLLGTRYGGIQYLVNDILYNIKPLQSVFLPVNTYGAQKRESVTLLQKALAGNMPIGSFPAGYCSRYYDGAIQDRAWKPSFIKMAIESKRDIVPMRFVGQNSSHFYLIDRVWRKLGSKFDLCTALLPDEMFRTRGKSFSVIVGTPISWQTIAESGESVQVWCDRIRTIVHQLS